MSGSDTEDVENISETETTFSESVHSSPDLEEDEDSDENSDENPENPDEFNISVEKPTSSTATVSTSKVLLPENIISSKETELIPPKEDFSDDSDDELDNLTKFDNEVRNEFLVNFHPDSINHNYDEIYVMTKVTRDKNNNIIDDLHKTIPILSKYEKTKVLGQRAKQINSGSKPLIRIEENIIDGRLIAQEELFQKKIPFIIRRPLPSGGSEYWHLYDLEILD
jgi:DNA-directed RNA polymerase subunit K/omega